MAWQVEDNLTLIDGLGNALKDQHDAADAAQPFANKLAPTGFCIAHRVEPDINPLWEPTCWRRRHSRHAA